MPRSARRTTRPPGDDDLGLRQVVGARRIAEHADRLLGPGDLGAAAGGVEVGLAKLRVDLRRGDALRHQRGGVEDDPDLAVDAAFAGDRGDARLAEQAARDGIVDVPAQLLEAHVGGLGGDEADLVAADVGALDLRLEDAVGQVAADLGDRVADVGHRAVGRRADAELDEGLAIAFADAAVDLVDAVDAADRGFDPLGDLVFHLRRRGARLRDGDDRRREVDVRVAVHVHAHEGDDAGQQQADEQHDRRDRVADAPGRDVPEIHGRLSCLSVV